MHVACLLYFETWLNEDINNDMVHIDGYQFVRRDNVSDIGMQGVGMYVRNSIPHTPRTDLDSPLPMALTV